MTCKEREARTARDYGTDLPDGSVCVRDVLAIYAFAVLGYVTAAIAAYFVGRSRDQRPA